MSRLTRKLRRGPPKQRKLKVGDRVETAMMRVLHPHGWFFYWIVVPPGMSNEEAAWTQNPNGPFKTEQEAEEHMNANVFDPQCKITHGGMWDPAWDRPQ